VRSRASLVLPIAHECRTHVAGDRHRDCGGLHTLGRGAMAISFCGRIPGLGHRVYQPVRYNRTAITMIAVARKTTT